MKTLLVIFNTIALTCSAQAKLLKIAVVDNGITPYVASRLNLCRDGHKDFTGEGMYSDVPVAHGSHVASLIARFAKDSEYCLIIIKAFGKNHLLNENNLILALAWANFLDVDIINLSGGGDDNNEMERRVVDTLINRHIALVVAAGNDHRDLGKKCTYYPACYNKEIIVVGNKNSFLSNYDTSGKIIDVWEEGTFTVQVREKEMLQLVGTSMSAAVHTGKMIYEKAKTQTIRRDHK